jgi:hypothetical protein
MSANKQVSGRFSPSGGGDALGLRNADPQRLQNTALAALSAPQLEHCGPNRAWQSTQKTAQSWLSVWQIGQCMVRKSAPFRESAGRTRQADLTLSPTKFSFQQA